MNTPLIDSIDLVLPQINRKSKRFLTTDFSKLTEIKQNLDMALFNNTENYTPNLLLQNTGSNSINTFPAIPQTPIKDYSNKNLFETKYFDDIKGNLFAEENDCFTTPKKRTQITVPSRPSKSNKTMLNLESIEERFFNSL